LFPAVLLKIVYLAVKNICEQKSSIRNTVIVYFITEGTYSTIHVQIPHKAVEIIKPHKKVKLFAKYRLR